VPYDQRDGLLRFMRHGHTTLGSGNEETED